MYVFIYKYIKEEKYVETELFDTSNTRPAVFRWYT